MELLSTPYDSYQIFKYEVSWSEGKEDVQEKCGWKNMTTRNLEPDQWRNREEWRLVSGRRQQLLKNQTDR